MNQQELAQYLKPFIEAAAKGERVEIQMSDGTWEEALTFSDLSEYRIKEKTIMVNSFEVPEPMREKPELDTGYFAPNVVAMEMYSFSKWEDCSVDKSRLSRGICHKTKEAAIAHAKAMLGIDPNE